MIHLDNAVSRLRCIQGDRCAVSSITFRVVIRIPKLAGTDFIHRSKKAIDLLILDPESGLDAPV